MIVNNNQQQLTRLCSFQEYFVVLQSPLRNNGNQGQQANTQCWRRRYDVGASGLQGLYAQHYVILAIYWPWFNTLNKQMIAVLVTCCTGTSSVFGIVR